MLATGFLSAWRRDTDSHKTGMFSSVFSRYRAMLGPCCSITVHSCVASSPDISRRFGSRSLALAVSCGGANDKPGIVTSWGKNGVVQLPGFEVKQTIEDRSGRIVAVGNYVGNYAEVVRLLPNGSLDPSFGKDGVVRWPFHMFQGAFRTGWTTSVGRGRPSAEWKDRPRRTNIVGIVDDKSTLVVSELDQSGKVVESFGQSGYFTADNDCTTARRLAMVASASSSPWPARRRPARAAPPDSPPREASSSSRPIVSATTPSRSCTSSSCA